MGTIVVLKNAEGEGESCRVLRLLDVLKGYEKERDLIVAIILKLNVFCVKSRRRWESKKH